MADCDSENRRERQEGCSGKRAVQEMRGTHFEEFCFRTFSRRDLARGLQQRSS
jgi:hypothetical protein